MTKAALLRVAGLECNESSFDTEVINESFAQVYKMLAVGKPLRRRPSNNEVIVGLPIPSAIIIDVRGLQ